MLCCVCKCRKRSDQGVRSRGGSGVDKPFVPEKQHFDPNFPDETDIVEDDAVGAGGGRGVDRWVSTRDKMSVSEMRINYKLFDCLKREFADPAFVCNGCYDLLEQIDALQFQANELIRDLRARIDYNLDFSGGGDESILPDSPVVTPKLSSFAKRPKSAGTAHTPSSQTAAKKRFKMEPMEEYDDGAGDVAGDDGGDTGVLDDPDFQPVKRPRLSNPAIPASARVKKEQQQTRPTIANFQRDPNRRQVVYKSEFWEKANDEPYIRDVLSKKNFEYEVQLVDTISGHQHLIYDGCIWHAATFKGFTTEKYIMKWLCKHSHNNSYRCLARVATTSDNSAVIQESKFIEHNHELDPEEVEDALLRNSVREITLNHPEMTPIRVFKTVELMNGESNIKFTQKRQNAYLRYISRLQDKHGIPRKPRECKPGYTPRMRKKPLDKWKKTPSQIKAEEDARAAAIAAGGQLVGDDDDVGNVHGGGQVQHIIIQPGTAAGQVIVQQTTADGVAMPGGRGGQAFQIEYTGHRTE